jgi:hypothetical protein
MIGLRHSFIRVVQPGMETSPAIIVDPCFREQFQIPHTTDRSAGYGFVKCMEEHRPAGADGHDLYSVAQRTQLRAWHCK